MPYDFCRECVPWPEKPVENTEPSNRIKVLAQHKTEHPDFKPDRLQIHFHNVYSFLFSLLKLLFSKYFLILNVLSGHVQMCMHVLK